MMNPLVSVVTVVYNSVTSIEATIESVLSQSTDKFEYIIIDGGSTDGTLNLIEKYKNRLSYFVSEKDNGIYSAMNKGVNVAKGDYCIFMNSGDAFCHPNVLSEISPVLKSMANGIVYGDVMTVRKEGVPVLKRAEEPGNKHRMYFCHQSAFACTHLLKKFPFDETYKMSADFKFFKQCYQHHIPFVHVPIPIAVFNLHGISKVQRLRGLRENIRVISENDRGFEKIRLLLRILPSYLFKQVRSWLS
jgi:glycosyltransferase involved in cell wall biosynthesis